MVDSMPSRWNLQTTLPKPWSSSAGNNNQTQDTLDFGRRRKLRSSFVQVDQGERLKCGSVFVWIPGHSALDCPN